MKLKNIFRKGLFLALTIILAVAGGCKKGGNDPQPPKPTNFVNASVHSQLMAKPWVREGDGVTLTFTKAPTADAYGEYEFNMVGTISVGKWVLLETNKMRMYDTYGSTNYNDRIFFLSNTRFEYSNPVTGAVYVYNRTP